MAAQLALSILLSVAASAANPANGVSRLLHVGPGFEFARIEDAVSAAKSGDMVVVHSLPGGDAYEQTAVLVRKPGITIIGDPDGGGRVRISGKGFNYSGEGSVPRAVFQFDPEADGCTLSGFEIFDARNESHNGAGVRINQADNVTVRNCEIHRCDMGVMSNGAPSTRAAKNQLFEKCNIHHNGSADEPGFSHNMYLGGWNATVKLCEVHHSTCGHNIKSRTGIILIEDSYIHDSANRELDIVDADETNAWKSDAYINRCLIIKAKNCKGNRAVIHYGQDMGGVRNGTMYIDETTIVTPFNSPVVQMSSPNVHAALSKTTVWDGGAGRNNMTLISVSNGASLDHTLGYKLSLAHGFEKGLPAHIAYTSPGQRTRYIDPGERLELENPISGEIVFTGY
ncbi:MAG: right-handed parallel beta-helix repeat-containing protein [bacterium]